MASKTIIPANINLPVTVSVAFSVTDNVLTTTNLRVKDPNGTVIAGATAFTVLVRHGGIVSDTSRPIALVQAAFKPTSAGTYIVDDSGAAYTPAPIAVVNNTNDFTITAGNASAVISKTSANLLTSLNIGGETLASGQAAKVSIPVTLIQGRSKSMPDSNGFSPQAAGQNILVVEDASSFSVGQVIKLKWQGTVGNYFGTTVVIYDEKYGFYGAAVVPDRQFYVNRGTGSQYVLTANDVFQQGLQVEITNAGTVPTHTPVIGEILEDKFWFDDFTANGGFTITAKSGNSLTLSRNLPFDVIANTVVELTSGITSSSVIADFTPVDAIIETQTEQYVVIRQRGVFKNGATTFFPLLEGTLRTHFYKNQPFIRQQFQANNHSKNNAVPCSDISLDALTYTLPTAVAGTGSDSVLDNATARTRDIANNNISTIQAGSIKLSVAEFSEKFPKGLTGSGSGLVFGIYPNTGTPHTIFKSKAPDAEWYIGTNADVATALTKFHPNAVQTPSEVVASRAFRAVSSVKDVNITAAQVGGDALLAQAVNKAEKLISVAYDPSVGEPLTGSSFGTNPGKDIRGYRNDAHPNGYGWNQFGILNWNVGPDNRCFNHYDIQAHLLMDFLRSGNAEGFRRGSEAARQMAAIGMIRSRVLFNNNQYNQMQGVAWYEDQNRNPEIGFLKHSWVEGLWMYWALTGDEQVHEIALTSVTSKDETGATVPGSLMVADFGPAGPSSRPGAYYGNTTSGSFDILEFNDGARYVGWSIFNLLAAYRFTGVAAYLAKAQQYAECFRLSEIAQGSRGVYISASNDSPNPTPGTPTIGDNGASSFIWPGYSMLGIIELYKLTGSANLGSFLVRVGLHVLKGDANLPDDVNGFYPNAVLRGGNQWPENTALYEATHLQYKFFNDAASTLSTGISSGALTIPVTNSSKMIAPGDYFSDGHILITDGTNREVIRYTINNGTNQLTVPAGGRGYLGTTARAWSAGATVAIFGIDGEPMALYSDLIVPILSIAGNISGRADLKAAAKKIFLDIGLRRGGATNTNPKPLFDLTEPTNRSYINLLVNNGPGASIKVYGHTVYAIQGYFADVLNNPTPVASSLSSTSAAQGSGAQTITITGTGFLSTSVAKIDGSARTTVFIDSTHLTIALLAGDMTTSGIKLITVENPTPGGGASNNLNFAVTAGSTNPTISLVSPNTAIVGTATGAITITGTNLASATVTIAGVAVTPTSNTSTQIVLPSQTFGSAGSKAIVVTNSGGTVNSSITVSAVPAPTISGVSPLSVLVNQATGPITITGTNLTAATVSVNGVAVTPTSNTATQIVLPSGTFTTVGSKPVVVTTSGGTANDSILVTANVPTISAINPTTLQSLQPATNITITGTNLTGATVSFNGVNVTVVSNTATQLVVTIPTQGTPGTFLLDVTTVGGNDSQNYTISALPVPSISTISPSSAVTGVATGAITITGTNLASATITVDGVAVTPVTNTATQITLPSQTFSTVGSKAVVVTTAGGTANTSITVSAAVLPAPTIASTSPVGVNAGAAAQSLVLTGTGYQSGAIVRVNGAARTTTFISPTQLSVALLIGDFAIAGNLLLSVLNPDAQTSSNFTFVVAAIGTPTINSLSPALVNPGSPGFTLVVLGANFTSGSVVNLNGTAQSTAYVSASRLEVVVAAGLVAVAGSLLVTVTNAGVGTSAAATLPIQTATSSLPKLRPGMRPAKVTLQVDQGKTFQITRQLKTSDGVSFDLSGVTMRLQARRRIADEELGVLPLLDLTTENGGILVDVPTGSFTINMTAVDTTNLRFHRCPFEMEATTLQGVVVSLLVGDIRIKPEYVR